MAEDILEIGKSLYEKDKAAWGEIYEKAREDQVFMGDEPYAMWDNREYQARIAAGRPIITIDQLSQFIHQVANDIRMNTPSINVIPTEKTDEETSEVVKGIIRGIEYKSRADEVYDTASNNAVRCSIGFIRVDHQYINDTGFEQELIIKRVINPLAVLIDSDSTEADGRDAEHAFILEDVTVDQYKKRWPGKTPSDFTSKREKKVYKDSEVVTVAEFFRIEYDAITLNDGSQTRTAQRPRIMRYWLSGQEVLESGPFPGKYVPVIPVYGEELWIDGKRTLLSLIRKSKDVQRMYNLWASLETELLMKQPIAPVMAAAGSIEDYKQDWINPSKAMALRYKAKDEEGNPVPPPQRLNAPQVPTGIVNARVESLNDIKASLGMYNSSIGQKSNAVSGVAINAQKLEGDVATYHFGDNLTRAITQCGRVIISAMPEVYDTARVVSTLDVEDKPSMVGINGLMVEGQKRPFDLTNLDADVRVTTGASFTTRRQETVAAMNEMFRAQPQLIPIMGDIYFENSDFAGAEAMAERLRKTMDPKLLDTGDDPEKNALTGKLQEAAMAIQQMQQALEQKDQQLKAKDYTVEAKQADDNLRSQEQILQLKRELAVAQISLRQKEAVDAVRAAAPEPEEIDDEEVQQVQPMGQQMGDVMPIEDEGTLLAMLENVRAKRSAEEMAAQIEAEEKAQRDMQSQALLQSLDGIQQMLGQLTQAIVAPKVVQKDSQGNVVGVSTVQ